MQDALNIKVGQIWEDTDPRNGHECRQFRIDRIDLDTLVGKNHVGHLATVTNLTSGRVTKISVDRLKPGSRGYRLIRDAR